MVMQRERTGLVPPPLPGITDSDKLLKLLQEIADRLKPAESAFPGMPPYNVRKFELDTAKPTSDPQEMDLPGDTLTFYSDGDYKGIQYAIDSPTNDWITVGEFGNPYQYPAQFQKVYLSWTQQVGKYLRVHIGREAGASASVQITAEAPRDVFQILETDKDTHFTGALTQYAKEDENISGLLYNKIRIIGVGILSDQQLHYKLLLWYKDTFEDTDLDLDEYCAEIDLDLPTYGFQVGGTGKWYMDIRGLHADYQDLDGSHELHSSLINMSATSKTAGAAGEVKLFIAYAPMT